MLLVALLVIPVATSLACWPMRRLRWLETVDALGATATLATAMVVVVRVVREGPLRGGPWDVLYVDALSALMIGVVAGVGFAAALVSVRYLRHDLAAGHVPRGLVGARWYYVGLHAFVWTMLATVSVDNLGLLWVGIEATTLASALLVGFYRTEAALEAAWKYILLCTVGITVALFGVLLTYYAAHQGGGPATLDWSALAPRGGELDSAMMRLAFVCVLVGFGTKAGFAPLHTWLADAHSQAPSPISALLSGVLLSCALYGIIRFQVVTAGAAGTAFPSRLLLAFGVLSVAIAVPFVIVQRDLKRLLAYSSVEHVGLMAVALGIGGPLGVYAGLLHLINHAATKALLFFIAGDVVQRFGTRRIGAIRGAIQVAPLLGWGLLLGTLAIAGAPPTGIFVSELGIASAGFAGSRLEVASVVAVIILLGLAFAGLVGHAIRLAYGAPPRAPAPVGQTVASASRTARWPTAVATVPLVLVILLLGIHVPEQVDDLLGEVAAVLAPLSGDATP
jgi:hydrogenase-4 component F